MGKTRKTKKRRSKKQIVREPLPLRAKSERIKALAALNSSLFKNISNEREIQFKEGDNADIIIRVKCDNPANGDLSKSQTSRMRNWEKAECSGINTNRGNQATYKIDQTLDDRAKTQTNDEDDEVVFVNNDNDVICVEPYKFKRKKYPEEQVIEIFDDSSSELLPVTIELLSPAGDHNTQNECTSPTEKNRNEEMSVSTLNESVTSTPVRSVASSNAQISVTARATSTPVQPVGNSIAEMSVSTLNESVTSTPIRPVKNSNAEMSVITLTESTISTPAQPVGNSNAEKSVIELSESTICTPVGKGAEMSVITLSESVTSTPVQPVGNCNPEVNMVKVVEPVISRPVWPVGPVGNSNPKTNVIKVTDSITFNPAWSVQNTNARIGNMKCTHSVSSNMQRNSYTCANCLTSGFTQAAGNGPMGMYSYPEYVTGIPPPVENVNVNTGLQIPYFTNMQPGPSTSFAPYYPSHADILRPHFEHTTLLPPNGLNMFGFNFLNAGPVRTHGLRPIFIDGSNVAMGHSNGKYFSVHGLKICIDYFKIRGHEVTAILPLFRKRYDQSSNPALLEEMEKLGLVKFTPSRKINGKNIVPYDDRYIILLAHVYKGIIVSSDNFQDLLKENPGLLETVEYRILNPTWVKDMIMFPSDPLGRHGPKLDEFLRFPD